MDQVAIGCAQLSETERSQTFDGLVRTHGEMICDALNLDPSTLQLTTMHRGQSGH